MTGCDEMQLIAFVAYPQRWQRSTLRVLDEPVLSLAHAVPPCSPGHREPGILKTVFKDPTGARAFNSINSSIDGLQQHAPPASRSKDSEEGAGARVEGGPAAARSKIPRIHEGGGREQLEGMHLLFSAFSSFSSLNPERAKP